MEIPRFDFHTLQEGERLCATALSLNLSRLKSLCDQLQSSNDLFDHTSRLLSRPSFLEREAAWRQFGRWQNIAARNGALVIYDFSQVSQAIGALAAKCPTLFGKLDRDSAKKANTMFNRAFPDFGAVRQAAAHAGEHGAYPADLENDIARDGIDIQGINSNVPTMVSGTLFNRTYAWTINGRTVSYELSQATVDALESITRARFAQFAPVDIRKETWP